MFGFGYVVDGFSLTLQHQRINIVFEMDVIVAVKDKILLYKGLQMKKSHARDDETYSDVTNFIY